jgi:hypothetical protein
VRLKLAAITVTGCRAILVIFMRARAELRGRSVLARPAGSDGLQRFGPRDRSAQGADLMQVTEHLDADRLVESADPDRIEAG